MAVIKRYTYAFDPTGRLEANLIKNERHTITPENRTPQNVLIPGFAPYFRQSLIVTDIHTGRPLQEGIDYTCEWPVLSTADNTEGYTPLYGGIQFIDNNITGQFEIQYQTIGGQYALDGVAIAQALANQANDPLVTTYEDIIGKPLKLPPLEHVHSINDFVGFEDLCRELVLLKEAIELLAREDRDSHPGYDTLIDSYFRLEDVMNKNKESIDSLSKDVRDQIQEIRDNTRTLINQLTENLNQRINNLETTLGGQIQALRTELDNTVKQAIDNLTKLITSLRSDFNGFVTGELHPSITWLNRFNNEVKNGFISGYINRNDGLFETLPGLSLTQNQYDYVGFNLSSQGTEGKPIQQVTQFISVTQGGHYIRIKDMPEDPWYVERLVTDKNILSIIKANNTGNDAVVFINGEQTILGAKTFAKGVSINPTGTGNGDLYLTKDANGVTVQARGTTQDAKIKLLNTGYIDFISANNAGIRLEGDDKAAISRNTQDNRTVLYMGDISVNDFYVRSDKKLKENIEPIENGLDTILKLNGKTFDWKVSRRHAAGFIAQEVEQVCDHLVSKSKEGTLSVNYVDVIAYLVEAIKEQQKQINELQKKLK